MFKNLALDIGEFSGSWFGHFTFMDRVHKYPLNMRLGRPVASLDMVTKKRYLLELNPLYPAHR